MDKELLEKIVLIMNRRDDKEWKYILSHEIGTDVMRIVGVNNKILYSPESAALQALRNVSQIPLKELKSESKAPCELDDHVRSDLETIHAVLSWCDIDRRK